MNRISRLMKIAFSTALLAIVVTAGLALTSGTADARSGGPGGPPLLCGWTALWTCTLPNGDVVEVAGTQCDIARFEKRTGATCSL